MVIGWALAQHKVWYSYYCWAKAQPTRQMDFSCRYNHYILDSLCILDILYTLGSLYILDSLCNPYKLTFVCQCYRQRKLQE